MTLTALTRFISKTRKGEIFQVERDGNGGANIYFHCTDPKTGKFQYFTTGCEKVEKNRVSPDTFSKLSIRADSTAKGSKTGKRRKILSFDDMYIIGYGFQSIDDDVPMG